MKTLSLIHIFFIKLKGLMVSTKGKHDAVQRGFFFICIQQQIVAVTRKGDSVLYNLPVIAPGREHIHTVEIQAHGFADIVECRIQQPEYSNIAGRCV